MIRCLSGSALPITWSAALTLSTVRRVTSSVGSRYQVPDTTRLTVLSTPRPQSPHLNLSLSIEFRYKAITMVLGRLTHYAFDAVLISAFLAGIKRSTGLT
ncbi:hypothetical protein VTN00DRAFT_774 [Thermoascus crustaceus]|uniref:uncharacterized protein n=1 Tax=Thermoascus crustaceus TaxID=5088 RepID=UPI003743E215